jgi:ABC-type antimicrobial peptide transport system permease subunit
MQDLLYQVSSTDPIIFALAPIVVLVVAVIAAMMPAIRASGVNPIEALRCE